ncbi:plant cysteine oxidase 3 [Chenopodium quinoa]|uniref:plant cysteine oxidase 3 n=1 Tax=Chenopodium quinoa TaxID=63459 RepID=UPI000B780FFB|nr:plant cysteine oxidase 3 [Chenopodium quinoa]
MANKTSKIQTIYDFCKKMFSLTTIPPPPSSHVVQKLSSLLDSVTPADVGLKEENVDDDRGYGLSLLNPFNRAPRWAQPITYLDIHESDTFTMCIFSFPTSAVIPLHDHPGMTVFSKLLYGSLHVKAYDWVEPPQVVQSNGSEYSQVRLAKLVIDKVLTAPCETRVLYPKSGGNLHCFTAVTPCAVLDILTPPYLEDAGRKCTYYHDYPYSSFPTKEAIGDGKEEEYAWLAEIEAPNVQMRPGIYAGPSLLE